MLLAAPLVSTDCTVWITTTRCGVKPHAPSFYYARVLDIWTDRHWIFLPNLFRIPPL